MGRPGNGSACPHAAHEMRDPPLGLLPDLGACRRLVGAWVLRVPVLIRLEGAGNVTRQPGRDAVVALRGVGRDVRRAEDDLRAIGPQQRLLLDRLLVGHDEDAAIALERRGDREPMTRVARRRLDDRATRPEESGSLGRLDHRQPDAVLHGAARVQHLELREQQGLALRRTKVPRNPAQADEGCAADQVEDRLGELHRRRV